MSKQCLWIPADGAAEKPHIEAGVVVNPDPWPDGCYPHGSASDVESAQTLIEVARHNFPQPVNRSCTRYSGLTGAKWVVAVDVAGPSAVSAAPAAASAAPRTTEVVEPRLDVAVLPTESVVEWSFAAAAASPIPFVPAPDVAEPSAGGTAADVAAALDVGSAPPGPSHCPGR